MTFLERDLGLDRIIVRADSTPAGFDKALRRQSLNVGMNIAVIAPKRGGQLPDAGYLVAPDITDQLGPLAGQNPRQRVPVLECQVPLTEFLAGFGPMPGVDEALARFRQNIAPTVIFSSLMAHLSQTQRRPQNPRTSVQPC